MTGRYLVEVRLLLLSLLSGLIFALGMIWITSAHDLNIVTLTGDARGYMELAENLQFTHMFGLFDNGHFYPESFRSPGYPAFLAVFFAIFHNWLAVLLVQVVLMSIAPVLLYIVFKRFHERASWWGSVLFALEPTRLFLSASLLTDALFTCLFLGTLITLQWGIRENKLLPIIYSGLLLGISILVRPIAMFLPLVFVAYLLVAQKPFKRSLTCAVVLCAATFVIVFPWMIRNHTLFDSWSISSVGNANLMIYNAPAYLADHPNAQGNKVLADFRAQQSQLPREDALSLSRNSVFMSTFLHAIQGHEISYGIFHILKTIPFFVTDGFREIVRLCGITFSNPPNISSLLFAGNIHSIILYLTGDGVPALLLIVGSGFFTTVFLLFLYANIQILRGKLFTRTALLFIVLVFYFALLTGPVSNARYRNPITGILFVLALSVVMKDNQKAVHGN